MPNSEHPKKVWVMVDVEADGPCPGMYSMIEIGAVVVEPDLRKTFHAYLAPSSLRFDPAALNSIKVTREETQRYPSPELGIESFYGWLLGRAPDANTRLMFISDNNGFDWQFINYYFNFYIGRNPFGHSSNNLRNLWNGIHRTMFKGYKHLRRTKHTHNALDDAMGNAEALLTIVKDYDLKLWEP